MRSMLLPLLMLGAFALPACTTTADDGGGGTVASSSEATPAAEAAPADQGLASVASLVEQVNIPYEQFTLDNGLRVIVHEDRKAPVAAVSVWYNVGSKDEPAGKTGFAHLFEHLMFNGSENAPGDYFEPLKEIGATDFNGTTWFDRTNYFQTVPRPALERALFLESDRMGHLLGAVTQEKLTNQIGVVQNEKRQGDNEPFGLVEYAQLEALFPEGHPYHHSTIGSMADLDKASLADVKQWFRSRYGPNNAVLVIAGDVSAAEARPLVEKYFGDIPRGPVNNPARADVPTLSAAKSEVMHDRVANTRLYRNWAVPGLLSEDMVPLDVAAGILGGLASSRLDNELVRKDQTAVRVTASLQPFHRVSLFEVTADVKPGVDPDVVARRLDAILADYIANGPTEDEVQRMVTSDVAGRIRGLEQVGGFGGKAVALAEGTLYANDPEFYRKQLLAYARVTPEDVRKAMQKWLTRPVYALRVDPGERGAYEEAAASKGSAASQRPRYYRRPQAGEKPLAPLPFVAEDQSGGGATAQQPTAKRPLPPVGAIGNLDFPEVERATLSNGIPIVYARRTAVPVTRVTLEFNAGVAADPANALGTQSLMLELLTEGTTTRNSIQIAEEQERLGAGIGTGASLDRTVVGLDALTPNLGRSLDLLADVVRNPAFDPGEVERLRAQQLTRIAQELTQPGTIAARTLPAALYGTAHPYGRSPTGTGDPDVVRRLTRDDLIRFHQAWIRPDNLTIFAVGDVPLAELVPQLEARFGNWAAPASPKGTKTFAATPPAPRSRIILVDRPQSPQSLISAGYVLPVRGTEDLLLLTSANEVLGGDFLSRINMDLRETKGWSYGSSSSVSLREDLVPYVISAPVQADKTGPAIRELMSQISGFTGANGVTATELQRVINGNTRELAGQFETSGAVLSALRSNALYRRPDNYWETIADRYRGMTAAQLDQAARKVIDPKKIVWVVVGDAAKVRPQLTGLGLPVEVIKPAAATPPAAAPAQ
ncbi:insulinase family protein [Sphingomonas parva]|uniref:Insulinase family protein n=1 Tax=Sphingomonas parva TaxID=2555898 RepID=A0A4Y8ZYD4_9SPHN|nr:pitrilysin family protein [Sphingomonas parva]TFI59959.1 insulinase family protein [Sphingomonas parva]